MSITTQTSAAVALVASLSFLAGCASSPAAQIASAPSNVSSGAVQTTAANIEPPAAVTVAYVAATPATTTTPEADADDEFDEMPLFKAPSLHDLLERWASKLAPGYERVFNASPRVETRN